MIGELLRDARSRWYLYGPLLAVWLLAAFRVLVDPTPRLPLLFNVTPSLPYTVALVRYGAQGPVRGDYVIFACRGPVVRLFPGLRGQPFFKRVRGMPGDRVTVAGRMVSVNGERVGEAKRYTSVGRIALEPIPGTIIPAGSYYMQGTSPDSLDSRYRVVGLVPGRDILAVVLPLF